MDCISFNQNEAIIANDADIGVAWNLITSDPRCFSTDFFIIHQGNAYTLIEFAEENNYKDEYQYLILMHHTYDITPPTNVNFDYEGYDGCLIVTLKNGDTEDLYAMDILTLALANDESAIYVNDREYNVIDFAKQYNLLYVAKNYAIRRILNSDLTDLTN